MMMDCPDHNKLLRFLDGDLSAADRATIDGHVEECEACQSVVADAVVASAEQFRPRVLSDTFVGAVAARLANAGPEAAADGDSSEPRRIGAYVTLRKLGDGGMGTVYLAEHSHLKKQVALKVLKKTGSQSMQSRFAREMQSVGKLTHPHIVQATDAGHADGMSFIAMELLDGYDARELAGGGALTVSNACEIVRQTALGLQYAHDQGLIHRDVKPSNVMVTREGVVKLLDLGLARFSEGMSGAEEITLEGEVLGTLDYMSPEQCRDPEIVGPRSDIFSLGATLFRLLSGEPPFRLTATTLAKLTALAVDSPRSLREMRPDLPEDLIELVDQMLQSDPANRVQTAAEVAQRLQPFCSDAMLKTLHPPLRQADIGTMVPTSDTTLVATRSPDNRGGRRRTSKRLRHISGAIAALLLGIIIYVQFGDSTLRIEINDPNITARVDDGKVVIRDGTETIKLKPGDHTLKIKRGDFEFTTNRFSLTRREREVLVVEFLEGEVAVFRDGRVIDRRNVTTKSVAPDSGATAVADPSTMTNDRDIAAWIWQRGGKVKIAGQIDPHGSFPAGDDWRITTVELISGKFDDESLKTIARLKHLETLLITSPAVRGDGLAFLRNSNLKHLSLYFQSRDQMEQVSRIQSLEELTLARGQVSLDDLRCLSRLPSLAALTLEKIPLNDGQLAVVESMPDLTEIYLIDNNLSDADLAAMPMLPELKVCGITFNPISDQSVARLLNMSKLEHLNLWNTNVSDAGVRELAKLPRLEYLRLTGTKVTDAGIRNFKGMLPSNRNITVEGGSSTDPPVMPRKAINAESNVPDAFINASNEPDRALLKLLKTLKFENARVTIRSRDRLLREFDDEVTLYFDPAIDQGQLPFEQAAINDDDSFILALKLVEEHSEALNEKHLAAISDLPFLKYLAFHNTKLPAGSVRKLGALPRLQVLDLYGTGNAFDDECVPSLVRYGQLQELELTATAITKKGFLSLTEVGSSSFDRLRTLSFAHSELDDGCVRAAARFKNLHFLHIGRAAKVTDAALVDLVELPLERLGLYQLPVTDGAVDHVLKMKSLRILDVRGTQITAAGLARLGTHGSLAEVDIRHMQNKEQVMQLREQLPHLKLRTAFGDFQPKRADAADQTVAQWLQTSIRRGWCDCRTAARRDEPAVDLWHHPGNFVDLTRSRLPEGEFYFVTINLQSTTAITDANVGFLSGLTNLKRLDLRQTSITDGGFKRLVDLPKLEQLLVYKTAVSDGFVDELKRFPNLQTLEVGTTGITDIGFARLAEQPPPLLHTLLAWSEHLTNTGLKSISTITSLRTLQIGTNGHFTDAGIEHLRNSPLETLSIYRAQRITAKCLDNILAMPKLKYLAIQDTPLKAADFAILKDHKTLRELNIVCGLYSEAEVTTLAKQLPNIRLITKFSDPKTKDIMDAPSRDPDMDF